MYISKKMNKKKKIIITSVAGAVCVAAIAVVLICLYFGGVIGSYRVKKITDFHGWEDFSDGYVQSITGDYYDGEYYGITVEITDEEEISSVVNVIKGGEYRLNSNGGVTFTGTYLKLVFTFSDGTTGEINYNAAYYNNKRYDFLTAERCMRLFMI